MVREREREREGCPLLVKNCRMKELGFSTFGADKRERKKTYRMKESRFNTFGADKRKRKHLYSKIKA